MQADLFISIHADSAPSWDARGLSAYILSNKASDALASQLAENENLAGRAGLSVGRDRDRDVLAVLADLASRHARNASLLAQESIVRGAGKRLKLLENPSRSANFAVLRDAEIPSILIETGFLSSDEDAENSVIIRRARADRGSLGG